MRYFNSALGLAAALTFAAPASAHVTLDIREAAIGAPVRLALRVPHGCGDSPTVKLRLRIPDGVIAVKPMPKPGWTINVVSGPYDKSYSYFHGVTLSEGVKEISWSGNLPDRYYDEFVVSGFIGDNFKQGQVLYFPIVQDCEKGSHRWIEVPKANEHSHDLKEPAPAVTLLPKK